MPTTATGPFFVTDVFAGDIAHPDFGALVRATNIVGVILKVTQGLAYDTAWFHRNWDAARVAGAARYGSTWFRGAYHFATPTDGRAQADYALDTIDRAGGFGASDIPIALDVEGDAWHDDDELRRRVARDFAARAVERTGRAPWLYSNGDVGIGPSDGFSSLWTPHPKRLGRWPLAQWPLYQYAGDGRYYDPSGIPAKKKFPLYVPGWGVPPGEDMSVVLDGKGNAVRDASKLRAQLTS